MTILKEIPSNSKDDNKTGCCPEFHPEKWDHQRFDLSGYRFIKDQSRTLMHIPLNLGAVMTRAQTAINSAHQDYEDRYLILSDDISAFKCDHYFLAKGEVPGYKTEKLEGIYEARVFDGPYNEVGKWMKRFDEELKAKGQPYRKMMSFYTTCPDCAKAYGHNYVVLMAQE